MMDALHGKENFIDCYRVYKEHNGGRTAQRTQRYIVQEKLASIVGEKFFKIDALSESFDDYYYSFIGIVHQMRFELVNLDSDSTAAVIRVFEDEIRLNGSESFTSQNFSADVINVTEFPTDGAAEANSSDFKRIVLQANQTECEDSLSVLRLNSKEERVTLKKSGTEIITKDLDFLKQLESKGLERSIFENNRLLNPKSHQFIIPSESIMVANFIYNKLDCASKFTLKYIMQGAIDTYKSSDCERVEIQHIYGKKIFSKENQILNVLGQFKNQKLTKRPCICTTKMYSDMGLKAE